MTDRRAKEYPECIIFPEDLPDSAPDEHPIPWEVFYGGNGHVYVSDANEISIAHLYLYTREEITAFEDKMNLINGSDDFKL